MAQYSHNRIYQPGRVFDGDGREIDHVVECDTETGLVAVAELNGRGEVFSRDGVNLATKQMRFKPPLRVEMEEVVLAKLTPGSGRPAAVFV